MFNWLSRMKREGKYVCVDKLRLVRVTTAVDRETAAAQLIERGILYPEQQVGGWIHGLLIDGPVDKKLLAAEIERLTTSGRYAKRPLLLLVVGQNVPYSYSIRLAAQWSGRPVEVVRLVFVGDGERAILGGDPDGYWLHQLRRRLADVNVISLVCGRAEAEEVAYSLRKFLIYKQQFFQRVAERCDRLGARFEQVAQGMGMDVRVGQGWLLPAKEYSGTLQRQVERWLLRQVKTLRQKTNLSRMAIWGDPTRYPRLIAELCWLQQVRITCRLDLQKPNNLPATWRRTSNLLAALEQADLLLILDADAAVRELDLGELARRMRTPIVIDTCACYPLVEVEAYPLVYRTFGQKTNVWNAFAYNRL